MLWANPRTRSSSHPLSFVDLTVQIPLRLLQVLKTITLVVRTSDVLHDVTQVIVQTLGLDEVDGLDAAGLLVGGVVHVVGRARYDGRYCLPILGLL